ncbi:MAG: outer membrane beta-barrel protein [Tenacibaculum sp.]
MNKLLILLVTLLALSHPFFAQTYPFKISGKILAEKHKRAVESATIHIERVKDSSVVSYTISKRNGDFLLEGKTFYKNLKLIVSYIGMKSYTKTLLLNEQSSYHLGKINLIEQNNLLNAVVVKSTPPILIKKDTLEFNVKSFKTKKDANVEELLKKLPGVEVDQDGKITANGKPVNKLLVNGKPFFGNDPSITTKNLSKDIVEKIQITDTKTKAEAFTGEKGDRENKTINLTIKKEHNRGWFGRVAAGIGTDKRYEGATMINRFSNDQRISLLASNNNINSPGFSFGEIRKMFGGRESTIYYGNGSFNRFGNNRGIVNSKTIGTNYADTYKENLDVNLNYFYSGSVSNNDSKKSRENILPDGRYFSNTTSSSFNENNNHRINTEFDIEIDSTFLININPKFTANRAEETYKNTEQSFDAERVLTNQSKVNTSKKIKADNFNNKITLTKKLGNKGAFVKASLINQINKSHSENYNLSTSETFGDDAFVIDRNQFISGENNLNSIITQVAYRYPIIAKKFFLDLTYDYFSYERENIKSTFDFDESTELYSLFNKELSTNFTSDDISKTPSVKIEYNNKKLSFNFRSGILNRSLKNKDELRPELNFKKDFSSLILDTDLRYTLDSKAVISLNYDIKSRTPSIKQLNPFTDISNPLNIISGNPSLKPIETHSLFINFNKFNWQKRTGLYFFISGNIVRNQVVSKSVVDENLKKTTSYENVNGGFNTWGMINYRISIKLDSVSTIKLGGGSSVSATQNINFFNDVKYKSTTYNIRPNLLLTFQWNKVVTIEPNYRLSLSKTSYDLDSFNEQNITQHNLRVLLRIHFPKKMEWSNDIKYSYNPNVVGFKKSLWFWNSTLAYSVLKDKGTITLKAYDLLNQNNNVIRRASNNYIEDSESTVLQQYFMLGFSWKFNSKKSVGIRA